MKTGEILNIKDAGVTVHTNRDISFCKLQAHDADISSREIQAVRDQSKSNHL